MNQKDSFQLPEHLAELGRQRIKEYPVEGFVYGQGPRDPKIMLIGEAPGETEALGGVPFSGRAGKELMKSLGSIGLTREDVYITSAVRSRPYKYGQRKERDGSFTDRKYNRPPTTQEIVAHAPLLDYEISTLQPKLIVTLGNVGLQRLLGKQAKVTELHGQLFYQPVRVLQDLENDVFDWTEESYSIIPTFHPASIFYRPSHRPSLEEDWLKIGAAIQTMQSLEGTLEIESRNNDGY